MVRDRITRIEFVILRIKVNLTSIFIINLITYSKGSCALKNIIFNNIYSILGDLIYAIIFGLMLSYKIAVAINLDIDLATEKYQANKKRTVFLSVF